MRAAQAEDDAEYAAEYAAEEDAAEAAAEAREAALEAREAEAARWRRPPSPRQPSPVRRPKLRRRRAAPKSISRFDRPTAAWSAR